ncbi:hypothetical protein B0H19DRAFT_1298862 [Mycena capillaripes]|nr:hypothetical protein B0H19DRAFT_1298862 [Mycena capillaripes]
MAHYRPAPLNETLPIRNAKSRQEEDFAFVKEQTGIHDADALKRHIIAVQTKAYAIYAFPCIWDFRFAKTRMSRFPAYQDVLKLGREREDAILLDLGCCCGTDIRELARDGFPMHNMIASDILADFWDIGHELFNSTPETFPVVFLAGDAVNPAFLEPSTPAQRGDISDAPPPLATLTSLTPLRGHVSVIHASALFHLFPEAEQLRLARALAGLLLPLPGSLIIGYHVGQRWKGLGPRMRVSSEGKRMFCHSPESWREMWEGLFPDGNVKVDAELERRVIDGPDGGVLTWSVTRI